MFRKTDPQRDLFSVETSIPQGLRTRLKGSWAEVFRNEVLPILMRSEKDFSVLYGITGQPNFSVGRMLGLSLLQELNRLTDQEALDAFGFDIRWQYALDVTGKEAYLSRRSLVEFRSRLVRIDPDMNLMRGVFNRIGQAAIDKLNISVKEQRVDSTHIQSNIHTRGRLALFQDVICLFLKSLNENDYKQAPLRIRKWHEEESNGWFGFGEAERKVKVAQLAGYMHRLLECYVENEKIKSSESYQLLLRLFHEQCEVVEKQDSSNPDDNDTPMSGSDNDEEDDSKVIIKVKRKSKGDSLQSAFDTDASYGHKGKGYSAHITETCNNEGTPEIITDCEVHGAVRSDVAKAKDVLERLEEVDLTPKKLFADGGYPSVPSTYEIKTKRDVELIAPVNRGPLDEAVMGRDQFEFNDEGHVTSCPEGQPAINHKVLSNNSIARTLHAIFDGDTCRQCGKLETCPVRAPNHRDKGTGPRETVGNFRLEITLELRLRDDMFAEQQTLEWKERYKIRAGVEATMSELKRGHGIGKLRVRGLARVTFAVFCKVTACNIKRWARAGAVSASSGSLQSFLTQLIYKWCLCESSELQRNNIRQLFQHLKFREFGLAAI